MTVDFEIEGQKFTALLPTPWLKRRAMESFMEWTFYKPNLDNEKALRMFDCMVDQMTLGNLYFRSGIIIPPAPMRTRNCAV